MLMRSGGILRIGVWLRNVAAVAQFKQISSRSETRRIASTLRRWHTTMLRDGMTIVVHRASLRRISERPQIAFRAVQSRLDAVVLDLEEGARGGLWCPGRFIGPIKGPLLVVALRVVAASAQVRNWPIATCGGSQKVAGRLPGKTDMAGQAYCRQASVSLRLSSQRYDLAGLGRRAIDGPRIS